MAKKEYFPGIGKIKFEGKESRNPLSFRYYDPEKVIMGKKMKDWLRFSMAWWHTLCAEGGDQFGGGTKTFPWNEASDPLEAAKEKMDAGFEIMQKLGIEYYCFHDVDLISEGKSVAEYEANLKAIVEYAKQKQAETGIKLLWGTANVFGHKRYMNGRHHRIGRRELCLLGRSRRLYVVAQYRPETRERAHGNDAAHGPRLCPLERFQGHLPHRAQAHGALQTSV
jgi:xylose isomerase